MSRVLGGGFVCNSAKEASGGTIAGRTGMLLFALVFVLVGVVLVRATMVADSSVGGTIAFGDVMSKSVATRALDERFWGNGGVGGDALVVHKSRFVKELT